MNKEQKELYEITLQIMPRIDELSEAGEPDSMFAPYLVYKYIAFKFYDMRCLDGQFMKENTMGKNVHDLVQAIFQYQKEDCLTEGDCFDLFYQLNDVGMDFFLDVGGYLVSGENVYEEDPFIILNDLCTTHPNIYTAFCDMIGDVDDMNEDYSMYVLLLVPEIVTEYRKCPESFKFEKEDKEIVEKMVTYLLNVLPVDRYMYELRTATLDGTVCHMVRLGASYDKNTTIGLESVDIVYLIYIYLTCQLLHENRCVPELTTDEQEICAIVTKDVNKTRIKDNI